MLKWPSEAPDDEAPDDEAAAAAAAAADFFAADAAVAMIRWRSLSKSSASSRKRGNGLTCRDGGRGCCMPAAKLPLLLPPPSPPRCSVWPPTPEAVPLPLPLPPLWLVLLVLVVAMVAIAGGGARALVGQSPPAPALPEGGDDDDDCDERDCADHRNCG